MARIPLEKALGWSMKQVSKLKERECIDLLCKKRNRLIRIIKLKENFRIEERGFFKEDYKVSSYKDLEKILLKLIAREFPRSHMLWAFKRKA